MKAAGRAEPADAGRLSWLMLAAAALLVSVLVVLALLVRQFLGAQQLAAGATEVLPTLQARARLTLAMGCVLAMLVLAFVALALRQVARLRLGREALRDLADKLRVAQREAEAASQAKSTFLANMSHEIRTPFHGLMGMLSLLREAGLTPRQIDHLRTATESADHLLALLNDILDLSQLESGRLSLSPAPVAVRTLLRDVEALMRPQASTRALALHLDADPKLPDRVLLDATRVKQILFNLLSNAIKFSDHGAVVLDVRPGQVGDLATLEFVVTDTGIGMDEATQSRLFSRFMQGDASQLRRHGGTGLGLEISRNLARLMDGDILARSQLGDGSSFTFWMPLRPVPGPEPAAVSLSAQGPGSPGQLRVLVAEDHPVNRQYMAALLDKLGHQAHFTTHGQEAWQAARDGSFDLVLMDLHMPVMDGVAATRAIRSLPDRQRSTVPIVALTADAFPATQAHCMAAGMNDFLTKPVSPQGLASCLRRLFGSGTAAQDPALAAPGKGVAGPQGEAQLVDLAALALTRQILSPARLAATVQGFLDQGPETVQRLRAAVRDAQPLDLRVHAHAAKGAALTLGLTGLAQTAQALQDGAAHLPAHEIALLVQRFEAQIPATQLAVHAALEKLDAAGPR